MNLILTIFLFPVKLIWWGVKVSLVVLITPIAVLAELLKDYDRGYVHGRRCRRRRRY